MLRELFILVTLCGCLTLVESGLRCFECQDMPTPFDCDKVIDCSDGDECFLDQFVTSSGYILFNQGCRSHMACNSNKRHTSDVMRASTDVKTCEECCSSDHCNNEGCHQSAPPRNSRGPYCYSCDSQSGEDRCRTVKQCAMDQACVIRNATDSSTPNGMMSFETGCIYIPQCHSLEVAFIPETTQTSGISVLDQCPFCCRDDFCNDNCNHIVTIAPTAAPVDGQWSDWSVWSSCTVSCDSGEKTRTRLCSNPAPQHNGKPCVGDNFDFTTCNRQYCAGYKWSEWSEWSACQETCGQSSRNRKRECSNGVISSHLMCHGGSHIDVDLDSCVVPPCANCEWTQWSACQETCGYSHRRRERHCGNSHHAHGSEVQYDSVFCIGPDCQPVDGGWGSWQQWTPCSASCGMTATRHRNRNCNNPSPQHYGADCSGPSTETDSTVCQQTACPPSLCGHGYNYDQMLGCFYYSSDIKSYLAAQEFCHNHSAELLTIRNVTMDTHIGDVIQHHLHSTGYSNSNLSVWLGIHLDTDLGKWIWDDQTEVLPNEYIQFNSSLTGDRNCVVRTMYYWKTDSCTNQYRYICVADHPTTSVIG